MLREEGGDIAPAIEIAPVCLRRRLIPLLHGFRNPGIRQLRVAVSALAFALLHLRAKLVRSLRLGCEVRAEFGWHGRRRTRVLTDAQARRPVVS